MMTIYQAWYVLDLFIESDELVRSFESSRKAEVNQ